VGERAHKGSAVRRLKVVHELGLERCETVRSLSIMLFGCRDLDFSTRGIGNVNLLLRNCSLQGTLLRGINILSLAVNK
jgi:hypothetical protein